MGTCPFENDLPSRCANLENSSSQQEQSPSCGSNTIMLANLAALMKITVITTEAERHERTAHA
jgi:hypothetical protein